MKTINLPEGYELDLENSTPGNIVLKEVKKKLPKSWEEIRFKSFGYMSECVWPTEELAQASKALSNLLFLRDTYNGDWKKGDETENGYVYYIINFGDNISLGFDGYSTSYRKVLYFKSQKLRDEFLNNFKDLITIALPLL